MTASAGQLAHQLTTPMRSPFSDATFQNALTLRSAAVAGCARVIRSRSVARPSAAAKRPASASRLTGVRRPVRRRVSADRMPCASGPRPVAIVVHTITGTRSGSARSGACAPRARSAAIAGSSPRPTSCCSIECSRPSIASTRTRRPVGTTAKSGAWTAAGGDSHGGDHQHQREQRGRRRPRAAARGGARGWQAAAAQRRRPPTAPPPRRATRSVRARGRGTGPPRARAPARRAARPGGASATRARGRERRASPSRCPTWRARFAPGARPRRRAQAASRPPTSAVPAVSRPPGAPSGRAPAPRGRAARRAGAGRAPRPPASR